VLDGKTLTHIPTNAAVDDEYTTELYGDVAGTLAMAKTSQANSATSEWYFNVHDNVSALDTPTTDSNGVTTSYTVFGKVLSGMNVVDAIAALPVYNVSSSLTTVPVLGLTSGEVSKNYPITGKNLVYTYSITSEPGTFYTATSDNNALVTPTIKNGVLSFAYSSTLSGTADITVTAKSLDGTSATTTFTVTVPDSSTPSAGPTAGNITAPNVVTGTTGTFGVLGNSTDSVAALNPSTVTIVTAPAHGTATVNSSTGEISYTPASGYTGSDSLTYTVADTAGTVSSAATVTLNVISAPVSITIGTAKAKSLIFTQPSGVVGHLTVTGGTAVVTFTNGQVTTTTTKDIISATGAGATITSVVITNHGSDASLSLTSKGTVSLGAVTDAAGVAVLDAPDATLSGDSSFKSINRLIAAAATNSTLSLGSGTSTVLVLPDATDTTVISTGGIASITSTKWLNDDGGYYTINTPSIGRLKVSSTFDDTLSLSATGTALTKSDVGQASAAWTVAGSIGSAVFGTPASGWSLTATGKIGALTVSGDLANSVTASSIGSLAVTGTSTGATLDTTDSNATQTQIGRLRFGGEVSTTTITATGNIGDVVANSLSGTTLTGNTIGSLKVSGASISTTIKTTAASSTATQIGKLLLGGAVSTSSVTTSGAITGIEAASLDSVQISGGTIGSLRVAGATTSLSLSTTAGASNKVQLGQVKFSGAVSTSSISTAGSIGTIAAASLSSTQIASANIASLSVSGAATGLTVTTSAGYSKTKLEIGKLHFGGEVSSSQVSSAGNIGNVTAASLSSSQIYAGVSSTVISGPSLPSSTSDFSDDARIASVVLGKAKTAFSDSLISADIIGPLHLGNINTSNSGISEGVAAHKLTTITGTLSSGGAIKASARQLKSASTLSAYETAKKLSLGDFEIKLI
jgi:hypothetical protein